MNLESAIGPATVTRDGRTAFLPSSWSAAQSWTLTACLAFAFAMAYAIAIVIFRLPGPGFGNTHLFRISLALHVELAVFFWLMATAAAEWSAGRTGASRLPAMFGALFTAIVALSPLAGGTPVMADYFPWLAENLWFTLGFVGFCLSVLAAAGGALRAGTNDPWGGARLSALPALAAALTALADFANGARTVETLAWGAGHTLLFSHVALMCWEWSRLTGRGAPAARWVATLLTVIAMLHPVLPFVFAPGSDLHKEAFTWTMGWLLWPAAVVLGTLIAWEWLRGAVVRPLVQLVFFVSFGLLLVGCGLGVLIEVPTTLVTAHYHAAIGAVAISRMGMAYVESRELAIVTPSLRAARGQLIAYTLGLVFLTVGLALAAIDAAPRKTADTDHQKKGPLYATGMSISGVGGLLATVGSTWLVINLVRRRRVAEIPKMP